MCIGIYRSSELQRPSIPVGGGNGTIKGKLIKDFVQRREN